MAIKQRDDQASTIHDYTTNNSDGSTAQFELNTIHNLQYFVKVATKDKEKSPNRVRTVDDFEDGNCR